MGAIPTAPSVLVYTNEYLRHDEALVAQDVRSIGRVHRLLDPDHLRGRPRGPVRKYGDGRRRRGRRRLPLRPVGAPRDVVPMFLRSDVARRGHRRRPLRHTLGERPVPRRRRFIRSALLRRVRHGGCRRRRGRAARSCGTAACGALLPANGPKRRGSALLTDDVAAKTWTSAQRVSAFAFAVLVPVAATAAVAAQGGTSRGDRCGVAFGAPQDALRSCTC